LHTANEENFKRLFSLYYTFFCNQEVKILFYKYAYNLLLIISNQLNNKHINNYKMLLGTALLVALTGCQDTKKKTDKNVSYNKQISDTIPITIEEQEEEDLPTKKRTRKKADDVEEIVLVRYLEPIVEEDIPEETVMCYYMVEVEPQFPGGRANFTTYMQSKIKYPSYCVDNKIEGRVIIQFTINRAGDVTKPTILRSANPLLDDVVFETIQTMPKWMPGSARGRNVSVNYILPVSFKLEN